jgi:hypothetical protein
MDKAVKKKEERDKLKAARSAQGVPGSPSIGKEKGDIEEVEWDDDMMDIHKDLAASHDASPADSITELKRKREGEDDPSSPKKSRTGTDELASAPPPPPPPPIEDAVVGPGLERGNGVAINGKATLQENGHPSPVQLATPSTNGSHQAEQKTGLDERA